MQETALFDVIIDKLRTTADVSAVHACLEEFTKTFFSPKNLQQQQEIFSKLPKDIAMILIQALAKEPITPVNQIGIKRQIDELNDKLSMVKSLKLTIGFQANDETISLFSDWIKKNVKKDLLIDLHFDKAIVGGALLISSDGSYKDYSVRKNLSNRFQIQRDDILGLLE